MSYVINGQTSNSMKIIRGTPQGETLSPLFFILFLSQLEDHLRSDGISGVGLGGSLELLLLAFADDIVFFAESAQGVQRILTSFYEYCSRLGLTVNTGKTKVLILHKSRKYAPMPSFIYGGNRIESTMAYTYLGVTFNRQGKFNLAARERVSNASHAIGSIRSTLWRAQPKSTKASEKLYESVSSAILLYAAEFWADDHLKLLEAAQASYYEQIYGWRRNITHYVTRLEAGCPSPAVLILVKKLRWLVKLLRMDTTRLPRYATITCSSYQRETPIYPTRIKPVLFAERCYLSVLETFSTAKTRMLYPPTLMTSQQGNRSN